MNIYDVKIFNEYWWYKDIQWIFVIMDRWLSWIFMIENVAASNQRINGESAATNRTGPMRFHGWSEIQLQSKKKDQKSHSSQLFQLTPWFQRIQSKKDQSCTFSQCQQTNMQIFTGLRCLPQICPKISRGAKVNSATRRLVSPATKISRMAWWNWLGTLGEGRPCRWTMSIPVL